MGKKFRVICGHRRIPLPKASDAELWCFPRSAHDDVIKWKHFPRYWPFVREFTGPGEFPAQRPVTRSLDVFFDLRLNKRLSKQSWGWWFETLPRPLWRHSNGLNQQLSKKLDAGDLRRHRADYDVIVMVAVLYRTKYRLPRIAIPLVYSELIRR